MPIQNQYRSIVEEQPGATDVGDFENKKDDSIDSTCTSNPSVATTEVQDDEFNDSSFNNNDDYDCKVDLPLTQANWDSQRQENCKTETKSSTVKIEAESSHCSMLYRLTQNPPLHLLIFFALQQSFLVISTPLSTTIVVAEAVCAENDDFLKIRLLSATFFMMGLSTFAMTTFGVRLPVFQGANAMYIIPLLMLKSLDEFRCPDTFYDTDPVDNSTILMARLSNETVVPNRDVSLARINAYTGSLIAIGVIHFSIGAFGLVSVIARLVGPITIVPMILLLGIYIHKVIISFVETHWPTALLTSTVVVILGLYLEHHDTPIPFWTPSKGFHILWRPFHRVFALLFSMLLGWITCTALTMAGVFTEDETSKEYQARTDARFGTVYKTDWVTLPYPGQFGIPGFSVAALIPFLTSCIVSVLESIGDYNATAKVTSTPRPPNYALNRGIAVEGIMSVLSGAFGCCHATVSFGENIGAMGITRVVSRSVFQVVGLLYMLFACLGKVGAFFLTIPYSVIGGTQIITYGMLIGVMLSYLEGINLRSQRNLSILGITIMMGMVVPNWIEMNPYSIQTGISKLNEIIRMLFGNPSFVGGFLACLLDNTIPGTAKDRGLLSQTTEVEVVSDSKSEKDKNSPMFDNTEEVYRLPMVPSSVRRSRFVKLMPIFDTTT